MPPPSDPASTPGEETTMSCTFTNLHPDALALLERLPEGDIPGIHYNIREGSVRIQFQAKGDVEEVISKFQDAYKKVAGSHDRRLRVEGVDIPAARSKEEVKAQISKFEQQYKFCAFVLEEEKQQVKVISQSRQFEQAKQFLRCALQQPLASASGSTGSSSTGTYSAASLPGEETTNVFTNLHPDALALLERLPEGDIPGIHYNIREGFVRIQFQAKGDVKEAISKFQDAYKKVAGSHDRRLRVEGVHIPAARSKEEVKAQISKFEQQYKFCAFVFEEEKRQVKVISQSRQFEQAKQFLRDALQQPLASASRPTGSSSTGTYAASMVITLPSQRKLTLKKADIVKEKANILVNAANRRLLHGGGVAGALDAASHGKLQQYSHRYMEQNRKGVEIPVGEVAVTHSGGALKCNYIIHTVGPDSTSHSQSDGERLVKVAIHNTLKVAEKYNATSIAIPALSCGIFGISKDVVARSITDAILGFNFSKPFPNLADIRIVIIDEPTHSCFARYFEQKIRFPQGLFKRKTTPANHSSSAIGFSNTDVVLARNDSDPGKHDVKKVPLADGNVKLYVYILLVLLLRI